tara:strand:+ start:173 stop:352 length:180 start_codon:yes stop_codon:yes gene_type:complete
MICCGIEMELHTIYPDALGTAELCSLCQLGFFARKFWVLIDGKWEISESQKPNTIHHGQ